MNVHEKLKRLMSARGWSEYRLSKECGLSESTLANIFRRNTVPSITTLETICSAFGITLSQFFSEGDMVELTCETSELFEGYATLTLEQKQIVLKTIKEFNNK